MMGVDFAVWVGVGAALGLWRIARNAPRQSDLWVNAGLFVLTISLVGARLGYAIINRGYFLAHPLEVIMIWLGGLNWAGAISGAWMALLFLRVTYGTPQNHEIVTGWIADRLYPLLPSVAITAWLGAWSMGVGYGSPAPSNAWYALPTLDETGAILMRFPAQFLAAITLLIYFTVLERRASMTLNNPGRLSSLAMAGVLVHSLIFTFLCADPAPLWRGIRVDTWSAAALLLAFCCFLILNGLRIHFSKRMTR